MTKFTVGQSLFFAGRDIRWQQNGYTKVTKVGRKWAATSNGYRIDITQTNYPFPVLHEVQGLCGYCYLTKEDYLEAKEISELWDKLSMEVREASWRRRPQGLTPEKLKEAGRLLGLKGFVDE